MTAAIVAIALGAFVIVGAAVGGVIWATRAALKAKDGALDDRARTADTLFDLATANAEIERGAFELEATKQALAAATNRAAALERSLIDAIETADSDLAPGDVRTRLLRIIQEQNARRAAEGDLPAGEGGPVLVPSPEA